MLMGFSIRTPLLITRIVPYFKLKHGKYVLYCLDAWQTHKRQLMCLPCMHKAIQDILPCLSLKMNDSCNKQVVDETISILKRRSYEKLKHLQVLWCK